MSLSDYWIGMEPEKYPCFRNTPVSCFDGSVKAEPAMAVFRKAFRLAGVPEALTACFSGDCKYRLFINGQFVDDGPVEVGGDYANTTAPDWWFHDRRDVTKYCGNGDNVIVAEVFNTGDAQTDYSCGITAFTLELSDEKGEILHTDGSWRCFRNPAFRESCFFDASWYCEDYHSLLFDDSAWESAFELPARDRGRWQLTELNLPPLSEETVYPIECVIPFAESNEQIENPDALLRDDESGMIVGTGSPVHFYLRFAGEVVGHAMIDVESEGGAELRIGYEEIPGVPVGEDRYITSCGRNVFRFTRLQAAQWVKVTVFCGTFAGMSYAPVKIRRIVICRRFFPLPETAPFHCSDPGLMKIRDTIDRTMRLCMMRLHWDSPVHQEGLGCTGDYMIESLISYSLYGETRLAAADILRTGYLLRQKKGVLFHTSYSLLFFDMVRDYYMWTADRKILEWIFPILETVLDRFFGYIGPTGLISNAPNYMFIDWINDGNVNYHHPPAERGMGCLTAFYCHALEVAAELADELGVPNHWRESARDAGHAFREQLWDARTHCFRDGVPFLGTGGAAPWCPPDSGKTAYSVHTNALALAYGLVPEPEIPALTEKIMTDGSLLQPQPYFMHFVFEALHRTGTFGIYGFQLLKRWEKLADEHPSGLKECWNCGDYSHAWGGTPAYQLVRSVFGVTPLEPGFKRIAIAPEFGGMTHASDEIPTIHGPIRLNYDGRVLKVAAPPEITVEIHGNYKVMLNP